MKRPTPEQLKRMWAEADMCDTDYALAMHSYKERGYDPAFTPPPVVPDVVLWALEVEALTKELDTAKKQNESLRKQLDVFYDEW